MQYATNQYEGMIAETIVIPGHNGDPIGAYVARPLGPGPFPAIVVIHHMPGWDEWYREVTRKFAHHGYIAISPNLYHRAGHGIVVIIVTVVLVLEVGGVAARELQPDERVDPVLHEVDEREGLPLGEFVGALHRFIRS
jgi:dienelactone hydrolase